MASNLSKAQREQSAILRSLQDGQDARQDAPNPTDDVIVAEVADTAATDSVTDVVVAQSVPVQAKFIGRTRAELAALAAMDKFMADNEVEGNETDLVVNEIIARILSASTPDEVLTPPQVVGLRKLIGRPFTLRGVKFQRSEFEQGAPSYALLDISLTDGGYDGLVSCGAQTVLAQLVKMMMLDGLPRDVVAVNSKRKPTANGYWPYMLIDLKYFDATQPNFVAVADTVASS